MADKQPLVVFKTISVHQGSIDSFKKRFSEQFPEMGGPRAVGWPFQMNSDTEWIYMVPETYVEEPK